VELTGQTELDGTGSRPQSLWYLLLFHAVHRFRTCRRAVSVASTDVLFQMELVGTVVLPVAICLTYSLIINYILNPPQNFADAIPLLLLAGVLGLPGVLILITTFKVVYLLWLLVYLVALPIWVSIHTSKPCML